MENNPKYISEEQQELFERFLMHEMPVAEQLSFKTRLAEDENLQKSFNEFKVLFDTVEEAGLREKLESLHNAIEQEKKTPVIGLNASKFRFIYRIAASVVILLAIGGFWYFNRQSAGEKLFYNYYSPDPGLPTVMGNSDNYDFYEAMVDYKHGDYDKAIEKWNKLLAAKPHNDTLNYFLASAQIAKGNENSALNGFTKVIASRKSVFQNEAYFYLGLSYLKKGELPKAKEYLALSNLDLSKELLNQLPD
ncbi:MAG: tetratricopeptide repeat protein [Flavobacteriaceae bacterium]